MLNAKSNIDEKKAVIYLSGRADTVSSECVFTEFESAANAGVSEVEYDLSEVEYICSATLRNFLKVQKLCGKQGVNMYITGAAEGVKDVFEITGFSSLLNIL